MKRYQMLGLQVQNRLGHTRVGTAGTTCVGSARRSMLVRAPHRRIELPRSAPTKVAMFRIDFTMTEDDYVAFNLHAARTSPTVRRSNRTALVVLSLAAGAATEWFLSGIGGAVCRSRGSCSNSPRCVAAASFLSAHRDLADPEDGAERGFRDGRTGIPRRG